MTRGLRVRLGLAVPIDGEMHVTWAGRLLDRVGLGGTARALGIGFVPDRVLTRWACEREQRAKDFARAVIHELAERDRARAGEIVDEWRVFG